MHDRFGWIWNYKLEIISPSNFVDFTPLFFFKQAFNVADGIIIPGSWNVRNLYLSSWKLYFWYIVLAI